MKLSKVLIICAVIAILSATVLATTNYHHSYVDHNNDGICDNYGTHQSFIDTNNDGICDNYQTNHNGNGQGFHHNGYKCRCNQ